MSNKLNKRYISMRNVIQCSFNAPTQWVEEAKRLAQDKKWSLATWLREAMEEKLEREKKTNED